MMTSFLCPCHTQDVNFLGTIGTMASMLKACSLIGVRYEHIMHYLSYM